jgi:hypothetical protein
LELPTNGRDADSDHVIRFADQTGLNCLPDQPLLFRVQSNRRSRLSQYSCRLKAARRSSTTA